MQSPEPYLLPERVFSPPSPTVATSRVRSPEDLYVPMGPIVGTLSPRALSPPIYESITPFMEEKNRRKYQDMDLPPTPSGGNEEAPPLPKRTRPGAAQVVINNSDKLDVEEGNGLRFKTMLNSSLSRTLGLKS